MPPMHGGAAALGGYPAPPPGYGPAGGMPGMGAGHEPTMLPPMPMATPPAPPAPPAPSGLRAAPASTVACPRCGTQTPLGFAFCQQCGFQMQPTPAEPARPSAPQIAPHLSPKLDTPIDPHAGTLAQDEPSPAVQRAQAGAPRPQPSAAWGTAVLVNRDGSDGQRFPLAGEYLLVGRAGADIAFDEDRFLARQHARIERAGDGAVTIQPMDTLNGVFRKADAPVALVDGMTILVGREVLRYERVEAEESKIHPLVRHGVALFGSPPREPWGRFVQLVPSGGHRDVRHLSGEEIVLGREEGDIVFRDDAFMSRRHAAVTWDGQRALITDLGSSNGTFVRIAGSTALRHGDHVRMGDQLLRIELGR
jgi:pSer/pThr/pTyr-binding forkhead associated (FHA) protein